MISLYLIWKSFGFLQQCYEDVAVSSVLEGYQHFTGTYYRHLQVDEWETKESYTVMSPFSSEKQKEKWRPSAQLQTVDKSAVIGSLAWSWKGEDVINSSLSQQIPWPTKGTASKIRDLQCRPSDEMSNSVHDFKIGRNEERKLDWPKGGFIRSFWRIVCLR